MKRKVNNQPDDGAKQCILSNLCKKDCCCHFCDVNNCDYRCKDDITNCKWRIIDKAELKNRPSLLKPVEKKKPGRPKRIQEEIKI